jgi:hypothetical protein
MRKSTILLWITFLVSQVSSVAVGLIVWGAVSFQAALVTAGMLQVVAIGSLAALVARGVKWLTGKSDEKPRAHKQRPPHLADPWDV